MDSLTQYIVYVKHQVFWYFPCRIRPSGKAIRIWRMQRTSRRVFTKQILLGKKKQNLWRRLRQNLPNKNDPWTTECRTTYSVKHLANLSLLTRSDNAFERNVSTLLGWIFGSLENKDHFGGVEMLHEILKGFWPVIEPSRQFTDRISNRIQDQTRVHKQLLTQ